MAIYADIVIIAVLVAALALGVKRGLLTGVMGIVSVVAAFLCASLAADRLTPAVEQWLKPLLMKKVEMKCQGSRTADGSELLHLLGFGGEDLSAMLESIMERVQRTGETLLDALAGNVAHSMAYALVYLVVFVVLLVVFRLVIRAIRDTKVPVVSQLDSICGGVLGLAEGALVVFVLVWALNRLHWLITPDMVSNSVVLKFFAENSPLSLMAKL